MTAYRRNPPATGAVLRFTHKGKRYEITQEGLGYAAAEQEAKRLRASGVSALHVEVPGRGYGVAELVSQGKTRKNPRKRPQSRGYRFDAEGNEQPVWASKSRTASMGREEGAQAARERRQPIRYGNLTYDEASAREYHRLTGTWPAWYEQKTRSNPGAAFAVLLGRDAAEPSSTHRRKSAAMAAARKLAAKHPGIEVVITEGFSPARRNPADRTPCRDAAGNFVPTPACGGGIKSQIATQTVEHRGKTWTLRDSGTDAASLAPLVKQLKAQGYQVHVHAFPMEVGVYTRGRKKAASGGSRKTARRNPADLDDTHPDLSPREIKALLKAWHGKRTDPDTWDEADTRLREAGIDPREAGGGASRKNPKQPAWVQKAVAAGGKVVEGGEHGFWSVYHGGRWCTDADEPVGKLSCMEGTLYGELGPSSSYPTAKALKWLGGQGIPPWDALAELETRRTSRSNPSRKVHKKRLQGLYMVMHNAVLAARATQTAAKLSRLAEATSAWELEYEHVHGHPPAPDVDRFYSTARHTLDRELYDAPGGLLIKRNPVVRHRGVHVHDAAGVAGYRDPQTGEKVWVSQAEGGVREAKRRIDNSMQQLQLV